MKLTSRSLLQRWLILGLTLFVAIGLIRWCSAQITPPPAPFDPIKEYAHRFKDEPHRVGHLSGFQVSVPNNYMQHPTLFMVQYEDDTPWSARTTPIPPRTLDSPIVSLTMYVQLPDFKPLTPENYFNWYKSLESVIAPVVPDWLMVSFNGNQEWLDRNDAIVYGLTRNLDGSRHRSYPKGRLTFRPEPQPVYGLTMEKPYPIDETREDRDNKHLYYRMEGDRVVTLIECGAGALSAPGGRHTCTHYYSFWPDLAVEGRFAYDPVALPHWREFEEHAKALLLQFGVACLPTAPACPPGFKRFATSAIPNSTKGN